MNIKNNFVTYIDKNEFKVQEMKLDMNPFDQFLAESFQEAIREELGLRTLKKIEKRVMQVYGINIIDAIKEFHMIDAILRENFGSGADKIEKKIAKKILNYTKNDKNSWFGISDQKLTKIILESLGDAEKKRILEYTFQKSSPITEIIRHCKLPKTTGYRLVNELINNGLLVQTLSTTSVDGKRIGKYRALFDKIKIDMDKKVTFVQILLNNEFLKSSHLVRVLGFK